LTLLVADFFCDRRLLGSKVRAATESQEIEELEAVLA